MRGRYARTRVNISLTKESGALELIVEDDGAGVEEQYCDKIFEEYFQAPKSKEGSGVGLYSAKKIVQHYKGEIRAEASGHGGARFTVKLPLSSERVWDRGGNPECIPFAHQDENAKASGRRRDCAKPYGEEPHGFAEKAHA